MMMASIILFPMGCDYSATFEYVGLHRASLRRQTYGYLPTITIFAANLQGMLKVRSLCFTACDFVNIDQIYTKFGEKIKVISFATYEFTIF